MYLNRTTLIGRLTADPQIRYTPSSLPVCIFSLATSFSYAKDGERKDVAEFHHCEAWDRLGESIARHMTKGSLLYVEGRLKTDAWDGECGKKHYRTKVVERCSFGPKSTTVEPDQAAPRAPDQAGPDDDVPF